MAKSRLISQLKRGATRLLVLPVVLTFVPIVADVTGVAGIASAQAQEQGKKQERETRRTPALRNNIYEMLQKVQEASEAKDFSTALRLLNDMKANTKLGLNSYELANMWNFYAFVYYSQENYQKTIEAYRNVLAQADLPLAMEIATNYQIAQLYFVTEDYPKAIKALNDWFKVVDKPQASAYILLAQAYYQTKDYNKALSNVEKAMELARQEGKEPQENWYLLMRALYYEKGDMKKVAWVLEELVRKWPKKDYWTQLSGIYAEQKNEKRQLVAYETAYVGYGFDREQELVNMAYLFLGADMPYKAAKVLEKGIKDKVVTANEKNYQLLGNAFASAQDSEKALPYLEKAAQLSSEGEAWARLANIYFDTDRYADAVKAGRTALQKGKVMRPDNTRVVIGMALFNLDKLAEARQEFVNAGKDQRSRKVSDQWVQYIDNEMKRRESLAKELS